MNLNNFIEVDENNSTKLIDPELYTSLIFSLMMDQKIAMKKSEFIKNPKEMFDQQNADKLLARTVTELGICYTSFNEIISEISSK